jgi:hypothetical protein
MNNEEKIVTMLEALSKDVSDIKSDISNIKSIQAKHSETLALITKLLASQSSDIVELKNHVFNLGLTEV